jgi:Protein of unknown function (DUF3465)
VKFTFPLVFILCLLVACKQSAPESFVASDIVATDAPFSAQANSEIDKNNSALIEAFRHKKSDIFVEGAGVVKKLLADDNKGSRHQKFLVNISPEQTLLFAHNIDLAPRIENLQIGDALVFKGEYVYNPKGGVIHWTHKDPQTQQTVGWIKHNGKIYE